MNPPNPAALAQLRDIHLPEAVPFWPLAPGWWVAATLLLVIALAATMIDRSRKQRDRGWQAASARELAKIEVAYAASRDQTLLAIELSLLLRRATVACTGHYEAAALRDDAWFDFVCELTTNDPESSRRILHELTQTAYRGEGSDDVTPESWIGFTREWIKEAA